MEVGLVVGSRKARFGPCLAALVVMAVATVLVLVPGVAAGAGGKPGLDEGCRPDQGKLQCANHDLRGYVFEGTQTMLGDIPLKLRGADFKGADLSGAKFYGTSLLDSNLEGANLSRAYVASHSELLGNNLSGANLSGAGFDRVAVQGNRLASVNLVKATIVVSSFNENDFTGARLQQADLTSSDFVRANFTNANLRDAKEGRVNIFFGWTNFDGARFCNTVMPNGTLNNRDC
jgi:uncharacterized protein YjbI with pentapeptide repeats